MPGILEGVNGMGRESEELSEKRKLLGKLLAVYRTAAGLTQLQLAQATFCDRTTVTHIEGGRARGDEKFWKAADSHCGADGGLFAEFRRFEAVKQDHETRVRETALLEARAKAERLHTTTSPARVTTEVPKQAIPQETVEHVRRLYRTDVGPGTIEHLHFAAEELCCEYAWRDPDELKTDAHQWLRYISGLLGRPCTLKEHRELLVISGWLLLLIGCVEYDQGRKHQAEHSRAAAFRIGKDTGHGGIIAWTFEMSAWFALTQGNLGSVAALAAAGSEAAPNTSVVVQLAAQSAKAAARMGQRETVHRILDEGYRSLERHDRPSRPENHFVIDPQKWDFYAMDCYRLVGQNQRAVNHAREVLAISRRADGSDKSPMRATEARLTLAMASLRQGDLDGAAEWTRVALSSSRKSAEQLVMIADELEEELHTLFPKDPAALAITEPLAQARLELKVSGAGHEG